MSDRATHGWCPACKEESAVSSAGNCLWCDTPAQLHRPKRGGWTRPDLRGSKYTEAQLRALHVAHLRGTSINQLAKQTFEKVGYTSHSSAATAISRSWKRMGLRARDRIEQTVLSSTKHGRKRRRQTNGEQTAYRRWLADQRGWTAIQGPGQARCEGIKQQPPGKGSRCERPAMEGSRFCLGHDPERRAEVEARTSKMRALQPVKQMVPMAPFAAWLRGLYDELGTWQAVADEVDLSVTSVNCYGRGLGPADKQPKDTIGEDVVRRCMEAAQALR